MNGKQYLISVKKLADNKCSECDETKNLQAHHLNYNSVGEEKQSDLQCLCKPCHNKKHNVKLSTQQVPRYYRVGNGIRNTFMGKEHTPIDAIETMALMTTQELWVISLIKKNIILVEEKTLDGIKFKTSCKSIIISSILNNADKQKFKTGYKRLNEKNILRRIKRQHYILNPNFIIPHYYEEELKLYNSLK